MAENPESTGPGASVACAPCRGTGRVVSGLGGTPTTVDCPWCEGTGVAIAGHDAQARHSASAA